MKILSNSRLITIAMTIAVLAVIYRVEPAKEFVTGDSKFLGLF